MKQDMKNEIPTPIVERAARSEKLPPKALRLDARQAAKYIPMNPRTLKEYRQQRRIPYYRIGHRTIVFDVRDLDAFIAKRRVEALNV